MHSMTRLLKAKVWHRRDHPKVNEFTYSVFYVAHPLKRRATKKPFLFSINSFNILSLYHKDLGGRNSSDWLDWITQEFATHGIAIAADDNVEVITHPRLFGYAFNPISFWILLDSNEQVRAVLCEVHNTFKDTHHYLLKHDDLRPVQPNDVFTVKKKLYVSPFNTMDGYYTFSFLRNTETFKADIIYWVDNSPVVKTAMAGTYGRLTSFSILGLVAAYPFMTLLVVYRIHWQAIKLYIKKVPHTLKSRPKQPQSGTTVGQYKS